MHFQQLLLNKDYSKMKKTHIVILFQYYVCYYVLCMYYVRRGIIRCTLFMVFYQSTCQWWWCLCSSTFYCHAVRVTRGALVLHWYTYAPPRCRTSQFCRTIILFSLSLWNDLADPVFNSVGLVGFKNSAILFQQSAILLS